MFSHQDQSCGRTEKGSSCASSRVARPARGRRPGKAMSARISADRPAIRARPGGALVLYGSAEQIPLPEASVDVVHARFAYFFPHPHWDVRPGLDEVARVLRPGGALVVIDNDTERGQFAELLRASTNAAAQGQDTYAREWWAGIGAETREVMSSWTFDSRADLEAVLRLEFERGVADAWLAEHPAATSLSYGYLLHVWR